MAGIGFELKKMLRDESWMGLTKAYAYAGIIGSGPWVLSILGILLIGILYFSNQSADPELRKFIISVTYLMSTSLIFSGALQLVFTRFISDQIYSGHKEKILPNLLGALTVCSISAGLTGLTLAILLIKNDRTYALLMIASFILLCNMWILIIFVSGMKKYKTVLLSFFITYSFLIVASYFLKSWGANGLLIAFLISHSILMAILFYEIVKEFNSKSPLCFDFLKLKNIFPSLIFTGLFYNLGLWVDKWIFWFTPETSEAAGTFLRTSVIYDLPVFIAHLSIIPGMASFLLRVETDFVSHYQHYYTAVNKGGTLGEIRQQRANMSGSILKALWEIIKVQGVTLLLFILLVPQILKWLDISSLYSPLYIVLLFSTALLSLYLSILNIMFYFNLLRSALIMTAGLLVLNFILTTITIHMGPVFYGYGFLLSILIMTVFGLFALSAKTDRLEYLTFMMQH
uniref:Extracellular Matrix protein PelG n=1 Tax=uncultured Thiotrichaceae bacterium TaxID=298394 RepID=A0A6S6UMG7_9GAMM|nr:MAG: Extracellular Matrix protein PelG [uncultured Thiotrichaceae bacterium]